MKWIDLRKQKPPLNSRILVCDENGYVDTEDVHDDSYYKSLGYPVPNLFGGRVPDFEDMADPKLVAWMPLPDWPVNLCRNGADGEMTW